MNEQDLWDLSDDDLEAAFKEAQASEQSPETDYKLSNQLLQTLTKQNILRKKLQMVMKKQY